MSTTGMGKGHPVTWKIVWAWAGLSVLSAVGSSISLRVRVLLRGKDRTRAGRHPAPETCPHNDRNPTLFPGTAECGGR